MAIPSIHSVSQTDEHLLPKKKVQPSEAREARARRQKRARAAIDSISVISSLPFSFSHFPFVGNLTLGDVLLRLLLVAGQVAHEKFLFFFFLCMHCGIDVSYQPVSGPQ